MRAQLKLGSSDQSASSLDPTSSGEVSRHASSSGMLKNGDTQSAVSVNMFKRSVNFSPYEKDKLLQLIRQYIVIFEDKRLDGVGRREKERAWLDLTDQYNSTGNVNPRTGKQLQSCWKNLKNRARDVTEACKRGDELPYFSGTNNPNTSYLPYNGDCANLEEYVVKNERFSDTDYDDLDEQMPPDNTEPGLAPSSSYSVSSPESIPVESPPITTYVYSPSALQSHPHVATLSEPASASSLGVLTSSIPHCPSDDGSFNADRLSSASRVPYPLPSYKAPERSISKTVDRLANSILFERGVHEQSASVFDERSFDRCTKSIQNKIDNEMSVQNPISQITEPGKSTNSSLQICQTRPTLPVGKRRKYAHRPTARYSATSAKPEVNGHVAVTSGRVNTGRYRRLEHEARMSNLRLEKECLESEHKMRCQLLQMKIDYYRQKTEQGSQEPTPV